MKIREIIGYIIFFIGFCILLSAGSTVDLPEGTAMNVLQLSIIGVLCCAFSLLLINWDTI